MLSLSRITYVTVTMLAKINGMKYVRPTYGTQRMLQEALWVKEQGGLPGENTHLLPVRGGKCYNWLIGHLPASEGLTNPSLWQNPKGHFDLYQVTQPFLHHISNWHSEKEHRILGAQRPEVEKTPNHASHGHSPEDSLELQQCTAHSSLLFNTFFLSYSSLLFPSLLKDSFFLRDRF